MATVYPSQLDSWIDNEASQPIFAGHFNNLQDAMMALQTVVGKDNASTDLTFDYRVNRFICASNSLYFYENTAPTGWVASMIAGDMVVVTQSHAGQFPGAYYEENAGNASGNWEFLYDTGAGVELPDWGVATHMHQFLSYEGGLNYSYSSLGYKVRFGAYNTPGSYICSYCTGDANAYLTALNLYTNKQHHTHTFLGEWRPQAAVGIIANYTGA